jgi:hypothetical protein
MKKLLNIVPIIGLIAGLWIGAKPSVAKPEYAKKEKKACTFCHVAAGKKELNDAGKYYQDHNHSLDGYTPSR